MDSFNQLIQRMEKSKVALPEDFLGCTDPEILAIEEKYNLHLPKSYQRYLQTMGHRSGRLFTCDHMAVYYPHVLNMTADVQKDWAEDGINPPFSFSLPKDGLLISGRLADQFEFIRCSADEDSPVWYFNIWDWEIRLQHHSLQEWLECWCTQAEAAIASGYFKKYPNGTIP